MRFILVAFAVVAASGPLKPNSSNWPTSLASKTYTFEKLTNGWRLMSPDKPYSITLSNNARYPSDRSLRFSSGWRCLERESRTVLSLRNQH